MLHMKKYWKIAIFILLVLVVLLGFFQRGRLFAGKTTIQHFSATTDSLEDYYKKAQDLRGPDSAATVSFLAVGDIMLSRNVAANSGNNTLYPFSKITDVLKSTAFNFGNLESPFVENKPIVGGH